MRVRCQKLILNFILGYTTISDMQKYSAAEDFLTVKEFADLIRVNPQTIYRYIKSKRIQAVSLGGHRRCLRIPRSEIERVGFFDLSEYIEKIIQERINGLSTIIKVEGE